MQRLFLGFCSAFIILLISAGCTKIDSTRLGSDLIPAVDNVNTFDTVLTIEGTQGIFDDSTRLNRGEYHLLGSITNDPVFGQTHGNIYLELKPTFYPYYFGQANDSIGFAGGVAVPGTGFDSAVLCLSVKSFYGDTLAPQHISVYQMGAGTSNFKRDSSYRLNFQPDAPLGAKLGETTTDRATVRKIVRFSNNKDSVSEQIRIRLSQEFLDYIANNRDTSLTSGDARIFRSDSLFRAVFKGFAVVSEPAGGANGLFYTSLLDENTRLEFHYRRKNRNKIDTTFSSFYFSPGLGSVPLSANANNLQRDRATGSPEYPNAQQPDALYIQAAPGTFALLNIPALSSLSNRIVHRAEIILEQIPNASPVDNVMGTPFFLYLDLKDTGAVNRFKTIYFDLNPTSPYFPDDKTFFFPGGSSNNIDLGYFGGFRRTKKDPAGNNISFYNFNVSRYVQNLLTKKTTNYQMRIYAPYNLYYHGLSRPYPNSTGLLANGRIKIGNGNNSGYRLRMRIVYSKI